MDWEKIYYFKPSEFTNPDKIDEAALLKLDQARSIAGVPFNISSSYRDDPNSSHSTGKAFDIRCHNSMWRYFIVESLLRVGFTRIGVYDCHIHADTDTEKDEYVMWTGISK